MRSATNVISQLQAGVNIVGKAYCDDHGTTRSECVDCKKWWEDNPPPVGKETR